jgi:DNA repair photolyase
MKIQEVSCRSALVRSALGGIDYALNPYRGCEHGCLYCYAPAVLREERAERWGEFVDVKRNIPTVLARELRRKPKGMVGIGTVTDAYQPIERRYEVTRRCLEQLLRYDFPITILTKSALLLRDLDLLTKFTHISVGVTITTIDDNLRSMYEPRSSPVEERLGAIAKLGKSGISTWVLIGPYMPYLSDKANDLERLIEALAGAGVRTVLMDRLRLKPGLWRKIQEFLEDYDPALIPMYKEILWSRSGYYAGALKKLHRLCAAHGLKFNTI